MLLKIVEIVQVNDQKQLATWVAVLFGFYLFLRKSNLVPVNRQHDPMHQLSRCDIKYLRNVLVAKIKWSKTNQFGQNNLRVPVFREGISRICPVEWLLYMVKKIPARGKHNLFSFINELGLVVPVTYADLTVQLREWLQQIGIPNVQNFSSHSLRRGGITHAFNRRIPEQTIKILGNWASQAYCKNIDVTLESHLKAWYLLSN